MSLDPHPPVKVLEVHEVAYLLKCSQETVRRLIRDAKLVAFRVGAHWRVDADELKAFTVRQRVAIARAERDLDARLKGPHGDR